MGTLIDTSWLIDVERALTRDPTLADRLPADIVVSSISIAELRMGVELADDEHREDRVAFIELLLQEATVVDFGVSEAVAYGAAAAHLRKTGQRIGERDLLIAATAIANGHSLITLNRSEFERVPGLTLLDLPDIKVM